MADRGTQVAAYVSLRSMLRALDEEDGELLPLPGHDEPEWHHPGITSGTAVVCGYERVPASGAAQAVAGETVPGGHAGEGPTGGSVTTAGRARAAAAVSAAGVLLAAAFFVLPAPSGEWASNALEELWLDETSRPANVVSVASGERAEPAEAIAPGSLDPQRRVAAFAELAQRALSASEAEPSPTVHTLSVREAVEARPGATVDLPFEISGAERVPPGTRLIVNGVPEHVALSAAEPMGDGAWAVPVESAGDIKLTAYALPEAADYLLSAELRSQDGALLARATTRLTTTNEGAVPATAAAEDRDSELKHTRQIRTSEWATVAVVPRSPPAAEREAPQAGEAASAVAPALELPDLLEPSSRSGLGGPH